MIAGYHEALLTWWSCRSLHSIFPRLGGEREYAVDDLTWSASNSSACTGTASWRTCVRSSRPPNFLGAGAAVVGLTAYLWRGTLNVSAAVGGSICLSMISACLLGVAIPTLIRRFRGDPRIAAGPVVLASADIATLVLYFNLSAYLLA